MNEISIGSSSKSTPENISKSEFFLGGLLFCRLELWCNFLCQINQNNRLKKLKTKKIPTSIRICVLNWNFEFCGSSVCFYSEIIGFFWSPHFFTDARVNFFQRRKLHLPCSLWETKKTSAVLQRR
jgi:hypothetical protein